MQRLPPRSPTLHSRLVRMATLILPVAALILLSTMFLLARRVDPDDAIPFAEVDVSMRARERQLTAPRFTGVSSDGTAYDLSAEIARPDAGDPRKMGAETVRLVLDGDGGARATVTANEGRIDTGSREMQLIGDVLIETSTGYHLRTQRLEGSLGKLDIVAPGEVAGDGPLGTLRAGAMTLNEDETGAGRLLFTNGVNLLYQPPS